MSWEALTIFAVDLIKEGILLPHNKQAFYVTKLCELINNVFIAPHLFIRIKAMLVEELLCSGESHSR